MSPRSRPILDARRWWTAGELNPAKPCLQGTAAPRCAARIERRGVRESNPSFQFGGLAPHRSANPSMVPSHGIEPRSPAYETGTSPTTPRGQGWSGWRDSNPRPPRWQRSALPLSYARSQGSQRTESNRLPPGMGRLPRRSASLRMKGTSESNRARRFQGPRCAPAPPVQLEIPVGPSPTWTRVAIWCLVCFGLGITMDGERGIEPRPRHSECLVLPLHQSPTNGPSGSTRTTGLPRIRRVLPQLSYARIRWRTRGDSNTVDFD